MINRQKLIEDIEREFDGVCVYDVSGSQAASDFIEIVYRQPPADQWIPCSEPPKEDGMYFITAKVLDKLEVQYVFYQKNLDLFICNGKPIAWMPAEPYKGGEINAR